MLSWATIYTQSSIIALLLSVTFYWSISSKPSSFRWYATVCFYGYHRFPLNYSWVMCFFSFIRFSIFFDLRFWFLVFFFCSILCCMVYLGSCLTNKIVFSTFSPYCPTTFPFALQSTFPFKTVVESIFFCREGHQNMLLRVINSDINNMEVFSYDWY